MLIKTKWIVLHSVNVFLDVNGGSCISLSQYFVFRLEADMTVLGCGDHLGDVRLKQVCVIS